MAELLVTAAGFGPTLQDLGRPQVQHLGVPVSGALDPLALRLANALVGNKPGTVAIEFRLLGPTVEVRGGPVRVALAGTEASLEIVGAEETVKVGAHRSVLVEPGRRIRVPSFSDSGVAYLAVEGGIDVPEVYGSRSTYVRAAIGGLEGRALKDGDLLPVGGKGAERRQEQAARDVSILRERGPFRVVFGPQRDYFTEESVATFLTSAYTVSKEADRMGMRLEGEVLEHARGYNIVSDGIVTGAVQVPGNGRPIVLLADHQTTGGYPKIGTVISADIPRLGRLKPGDTLSFVETDVAEAEEARRTQEKAFRRVVDGLIPAEGWLDREALYRENLVSGVVAD